MFGKIISFTKLVCLSTLLATSFSSAAKETVNIALTSVQPPLVFKDSLHSGLIRDLVTEMNRMQERYEFVLNMYPPSRIVKYHNELKVDLVAFNDLKWGWDKQGGKGSLSLTNGKDIFFTFDKNGVAPNKEELTIAAVRGFHYRFANFDPSNLEKNTQIHSLEDETNVVEFMSYMRADKGIASKAYLDWLSVSKPEVYKRITLLEEDHRYTRRFIAMPNSVISIKEVNNILLDLNKTGLLKLIFARYGQAAPPLQ